MPRWTDYSDSADGVTWRRPRSSAVARTCLQNASSRCHGTTTTATPTRMQVYRSPSTRPRTSANNESSHVSPARRPRCHRRRRGHLWWLSYAAGRILIRSAVAALGQSTRRNERVTARVASTRQESNPRVDVHDGRPKRGTRDDVAEQRRQRY